MIKIRLNGTQKECELVADKLSEQFEILSLSEPYPDRGYSKYVRVYINVKIKDSAEEKEHK